MKTRIILNVKKNTLIKMALIALLSVTILVGCGKEESTQSSSKYTLRSYDGIEFNYDSTFVNPYESYGAFHNRLFVALESI